MHNAFKEMKDNLSILDNITILIPQPSKNWKQELLMLN